MQAADLSNLERDLTTKRQVYNQIKRTIKQKKAGGATGGMIFFFLVARARVWKAQLKETRVLDGGGGCYTKQLQLHKQFTVTQKRNYPAPSH